MTRYASYQTDYGHLVIGYEEEAVTQVSFIRKMNKDLLPYENIPSSVSDMAYIQFTEYFAGKRKTFDFPYTLHGTPFQLRVWKALLEIPYGETRSYKDIALAIGSPKSCRATGGAIHHNPIWIAVPCHRVIGSNGKLTGYAGGLDMKEALLKLEQNYFL